MRRLDIPVLGSQFYYRIEYDNSHIAGDKLEKQMIGLLLCSFSSLQIEDSHALMFSSRLHHQRQSTAVLFIKIPANVETLLYQFRHFPAGVGSIIQLLRALLV